MNFKMLVTRRFEFDSAHQLGKEFGKCSNLHGHRYVLEVTVKGDVVNGIVIDISEIKKIVNELIIEKLDHNTINNVIENPTAENMALWIWKQLKQKLNKLYEVKLYETPNNYVIYRGE